MPFRTKCMWRRPGRAEGVPPDHPLSPGGATLAILDANVLLPPRLSDILFDLALAGLYQPRWTQAIEGEFLKNFGPVVLTQGKAARRAAVVAEPNPEHLAKAAHRLECFRSAAGHAYEVLLYDRPEYKRKVPKAVSGSDIHVASAGLVLRILSDEEKSADKVYVVSANLRDLAIKDMKLLGVNVVSPGAFIDALNGAAPRRVEQALLKTVRDLRSPPFRKADLLDLLLLHRARATARLYSEKWKVGIP